MKLRLLILALGFGSTTAALAEDLLHIYREAQKQDATVAAARATWQATQEKLVQGRSGLLPSVSLSGNLTQTNFDSRVKSEPPIDTERNYHSHGFTLSATQPVYRMQNFVAYDQARQQVTQADWILGAAEQDLVLRVAQAYFDALLAGDGVSLAGAQKAAVSQQLAQARRNFEVGTATITDTNEAQAKYDQIVAQEIAAQNDLEIKYRALQSVIGRFPASLSPLGPKLELRTPEPAVMDDWVARAEKSGYAVRISEATFEISKLEVDRNRAGHYPTLDLVASYNDTRSSASSLSTFGSNSKTGQISLQLAIPLYAGGAQSSKVREAAANFEKSRQDLEGARRAATLSARQAFLGVTNGIAQVKALQQALVSADTALSSSKVGMEVGVRTNVDVLNAQQQVYQVRRDLAAATYNYLMNLLRLKAAVGELREADLEQFNRYLAAN
ncbi:Outer membrane protein TolC [Burkholderiales bacterium]|nr:MAG: TolC family outer membrane protein [Burkholderiales bacterium]CAG0949644.1 Outer membrane protein TolC [Burkholderiales bacterium]